jgi:glucose/arabinose dehydrogenase
VKARSSRLAVVPVVVAFALSGIWSAPTVEAQAGGAQTPPDLLQAPALMSRPPLPDTPVILDADGPRIRVVPIKGLVRPWSIAFLPNGDLLVTELPGRLRIVRNGTLDPTPIGGVPEVNTKVIFGGLLDIALHPRYAENRLLYFTYSKSSPEGPKEDFRWVGTTQKASIGQRDVAAITLARARYEGGASLSDVKDLLVTDAWSHGSSPSKIAFAKDGKIIMTVGMPTRHAMGSADDAQNPGNLAGKVLRLNDDGTAPKDNPFYGKPGYRPEIFAMGIRNAIGLFVHPETGEIWETENGPNGGDEINIIRPGANLGWPVVSYGRDYSGEQLGGLSGTQSEDRKRPGLTEPFVYWYPSPAVTGITIYTGDRFPAWKGNIFVGAMGGGSLGTRQLHRLLLNRQGHPLSAGNMTLLAELKQRIRDVKQGPDGFLYVTTDEVDGAVLRIEPVDEGARP